MVERGRWQVRFQIGHPIVVGATARTSAPGGPQYRPLLLNHGTRTAPPPQHNLDLALIDSDARFIASRHATTAAPTVGVDTRADPRTDLESLAGSDDDDDGHMSAGDDEAHAHFGVVTRRPSIAASPPRPASLLEMHSTQPAQAALPSASRSTTAFAILPPPGPDSCAHIPARARGGYAGDSDGMGPHAPTPALVHLTTNDAPSPLGPSDTHASAHAPPPSRPMARQ